MANNTITYKILNKKKYFEYLTLTKANFITISGPTDIIKGATMTNILLSNNTNLSIKDALYSPKSRRNSLSFKDIQANGYHIETIDEDRKEYIYII